ncbi:3-beta hydroxysteroid dehydrogenase [Cryobacterium arcticum]|uniref:3-beta hydroxysteroid dehydrogenase n=1 Tax=Cryobacterium arcticum TaxID=670052 RepID=A0A317ZNZ9_9MICO|nr:3-beta hydroxysteroid dehydrogenase [Cryobacterium arcticum]
MATAIAVFAASSNRGCATAAFARPPVARRDNSRLGIERFCTIPSPAPNRRVLARASRPLTSAHRWHTIGASSQRATSSAKEPEVKIAIAGGTGTVGRHVTDLVRQRGHESVVLARSAGHDLTTATGLADALSGVDVVIDVLNTPTLGAAASTRFFDATTAALLDARVVAGVRHHVALSIVNATRVAAGYYAGKVAQESRVRAGTVPWTILRATQFHEFAAQTLGRGSLKVAALVPVMRTQPVAAREVAERLVELAVGSPRGQAADLGGPREEQLIDIVRAYAQATRTRRPLVQIRLPGRMGAAMRAGALLPAAGTERGRQTFAQWLASEVPGGSAG